MFNSIFNEYQPINYYHDIINNKIYYNGYIIKYFCHNFKIYYKLKNVSKILNYTNFKEALKLHVDKTDKITVKQILKINDPKVLKLMADEKKSTIYINEFAIYNLIFKSTEPDKLKFKKCITVVKPSIILNYQNHTNLTN